METPKARKPSQDEIDEESRRARRLRILVQLALAAIAEGDLSVEEASRMAAATRRAAPLWKCSRARKRRLIFSTDQNFSA